MKCKRCLRGPHDCMCDGAAGSVPARPGLARQAAVAVEARVWRERWEALAAAVTEHVGPWEAVGVDVAAGRLRDAAYRSGAEDMRARAAAECERVEDVELAPGAEYAAALVRALPVEPEGEGG